ncbi:MAG: sulfatase-like hydrolase/transferase, partial [bacterium]|nr:sulfatase-like hydrolase/transferase [bacterium]
GMPGTEGVPYKQGFDYTFGFYDQLRAHTFFPYHLWENDQKISYPANQGFDMQRRYNISTKGLPSEFWNVYDENGDLQLPEIADPDNAVYAEAEIEKAALKFVRESHEDPFFLYFATQLPHGPVIIDNIGDMAQPDSIPQPSREWAAMVKQLDTFTGELVDLLKELDVYDNTIIFFSSDNGYSMCGYTGRGNNWAWPDDPYLKNKGPFTGGKFSPLEGGIRIPFFVHWPAKFKPGFVEQPVWLPDFFPTAAALAGTEVSHELDGLSLLPVLE